MTHSNTMCSGYLGAQAALRPSELAPFTLAFATPNSVVCVHFNGVFQALNFYEALLTYTLASNYAPSFLGEEEVTWIIATFTKAHPLSIK
jgi:hypothetical protein